MNAKQKKRRDDIHTCHDQCERIACVQRREIAELERKLEVAKRYMYGKEMHSLKVLEEFEELENG